MKRTTMVMGAFLSFMGTGIIYLYAVTYTAQAKNKGAAMAEFLESPSGLRYEIINHGNSEDSPKPGQLVTVHYTGWLDDGGKKGKKFDSSYDRGVPFKFVVGAGQVIKGWDETLLSMRIGEKRHIILPPQLAYGENGYPGVIPPRAMLHFDVELLNIE